MGDLCHGYEILHTVERARDSDVASPQLWPGIGSGLNSLWQHIYSGTDRPSERWHHEIPHHPYLFLRDLHRNNIIESVDSITRDGTDTPYV